MGKFAKEDWLTKFFNLRIRVEENGIIIKGVNDPATLAKKKEEEVKAKANNNSTRRLQQEDYTADPSFDQEKGILTVVVKTTKNTDMPLMTIGVKTSQVNTDDSASPEDTLVLSKSQ
jgi:hypothetical protein